MKYKHDSINAANNYSMLVGGTNTIDVTAFTGLNFWTLAQVQGKM